MSVHGYSATKVVVEGIDVSKYTYNDLYRLNHFDDSYKLPLANIGLIDLNAFFAQVEQIRLGLSSDVPVVCVQWGSVIAVSYAARKFGIGRLTTLDEVKKKCPHIVLAHAAVFKKGQPYWAYEKGLPSNDNHKVSLDPYRRESRKIFKIILKHVDLVEKASVDECYMDFGRLVFSGVLEMFPQLRQYTDKNEKLPPIPSRMPDELIAIGLFHYKAKVDDIYNPNQVEQPSNPSGTLDGDGDGNDNGNKDGKSEEPKIVTIRDWDDVCNVIAAKYLYEIRKDIFETLGYTTSGGLARNKAVAKLAAGEFKPDNQLTVNNVEIYDFLKKFTLTDVTSMGGKIGDLVLYKLEVPPESHSITFIRENFDIQELGKSLQDQELAEKVYDIVRGDRKQELRHRIELKSMLSRKNFLRFPVKKLADVHDWIKVFSGDLHGRLIELDDESMHLLMLQQNKDSAVLRRPKTITVTIRLPNSGEVNRQQTIKYIRDLDKLRDALEQTALKIFKETMDTFPGMKNLNHGMKIKEVEKITNDIDVVPCTALGVSISNFGNFSPKSSIDGFLHPETALNKQQEKEKIEQLFEKEKMEKEKIEKDIEKQKMNAQVEGKSTHKDSSIAPRDKQYIEQLFEKFKQESTPPPGENKPEDPNYCKECEVMVADMLEHKDFHYAQSLSNMLNGTGTSVKPSVKKRKVGKGQSKLPF